MKKSILFSFITLLFTQSCDKKTEPHTAYIAKETKDFCVFQKGTWWEYENTRTNLLDTWKVVEVLNRFEVIENTKGKVTYWAEDIKLNLTSIYRDTFSVFVGGGVDFSTNKYFGLHQLSYFENGLDSMSVCDNLKIKTITRDSMDGKCVLRAFKYITYPCTTFFPYYTKWERHKGITEMAYYNGDTLRLKSSYIIQ
ncbi:MAG: hypothetical protein Q8K70_12865 [Bacteroidota bacterium]|nr:hypothetical protein [Bacteroidota bacterium]